MCVDHCVLQCRRKKRGEACGFRGNKYPPTPLLAGAITTAALKRIKGVCEGLGGLPLPFCLFLEVAITTAV